MQDRFSLGEHQISIGPDELLRRANDAMYRAKHSWKNRWSV
ncbi:hypothetical protein ACO0LC_08195 [Undibacterium sp. JH2W]